MNPLLLIDDLERRGVHFRSVAAAEHGRKARRRQVTATHAKGIRTRDLKAQGLTPAEIGKIIGASRATVYRNTCVWKAMSWANENRKRRHRLPE